MTGHADDARFAALFDKPSVDGLRTLSEAEFKRFAAYVFGRAGYTASGHPLGFVSDIDLNLFPLGDRNKLAGAVAIRHEPPERPLSGQFVRRVQHSSAVRKRGATAYVVTSGTFDKSAYDQAGSSGQPYLLDGDQFCRYIRYVHHSRFPEGIDLTVLIHPDLFAGNAQRLSPAPRPPVLALANNKGGVGKTTSARHLALRLAERGLRVLLVDLDPQGNLTEGVISRDSAEGRRALADPPTLADYFAANCALSAMVRPTFVAGQPINNVSLIPAHPDLSLLDTGGAGRPEVEMRFVRDLQTLAREPLRDGDAPINWVIIDTPPAISLYTRAALCAADYVIVPARARPSSLAGILNLLKTMDAMGELRGTPPKLLGCLLTHWQEDQQSTETYPYLETLFDARHSRILANYIPFTVTTERVHGPGHQHASNAYESVAQEVLDYVQRG